MLEVAENIRSGTVDMSDFCDCITLLVDIPACAFEGIPMVMWRQECSLRSDPCDSETITAFFDAESFPSEDELQQIENYSELCASLLPRETLDDVPQCTVSGLVLEELLEQCQGLLDDNQILESLGLSNTGTKLGSGTYKHLKGI